MDRMIGYQPNKRMMNRNDGSNEHRLNDEWKDGSNDGSMTDQSTDECCRRNTFYYKRKVKIELDSKQ